MRSEQKARAAETDATRWWILALLFAARVGLGFHFQTMASAGDGLAGAFGGAAPTKPL